MVEAHREPIGWEKIHVFVSSTFNDMHADRDYLVKRVFPELQDWCERRKLRLVDVDLRWGVTEQDATHNKNVVKVCLDRIDDCRPFFLCFLGQRRGWVPKQDEVSAETFAAFPDLRSVVGAASVTEMEILHALINPLHRSLPRDDTKPAEHYEPSKYSFFYLRDASYLDQLPVDPPMLREVYTNEWIEGEGEREGQDLSLKRWREIDIPRSNRPFHPYQAKWDAIAITPELMLPLQCPSTEPANIERWRNQWRGAGVTVTGLNIEDDPAQASKAREFNRRLSAGRLSDLTCEGARLSTIIIKDLQEAIADRYPDHSEVGHEDELQEEIDQQEQFLFTASEGFIRREGDFAELDDYVKSDSNELFVLTAAGGMGKSTLLANWVDSYRRGIEGRRDHSIHFRFIGQSDGTTTVHSLLRLLLHEIKVVENKLDEEIPLDPIKLRNEWPALLEAIGKHGRTVIVIDALNQLASGLSDVSWLPRHLPANVKLIVSFRLGDSSAEELYERFRQDDQVRLSEVKPFERRAHRRKLAKEYLSQYLKDLDKAQREFLINLPGARNPLYLKVVLSELRVFGAYANLATQIHSDFGDNPLSAFVRVLERLEKDPAYSPIDPKQAVPLLFGLLAHARRGLSVEELTSLVIQALGHDETNESREAAADTVNLFLRQVRAFLARREGRYDFFFESFKMAAQQCYVIEGDKETISKRSYQEWHRLLATYFGSLPTWQEDGLSSESPQAKQPTRRKVAELPHHLTQAGMLDDVEGTLCDLDFVSAKCAAGLVFDLEEDYRNAIAVLPEAQANLREQQQREDRLTRWTEEIIRYSQVWSERRDRIALNEPVDEAEPTLPKPPASCRIWTDEEIANESRRIVEDPTRLDRLTAFVGFVSAECYPLLQFGQREGFVLQHALNHAPAGPVHALAARMLLKCGSPVLLRRWAPDAIYNPKPALLLSLEGHTETVNSVSVTFDGRRAVSGSNDNTLRVWDLESGACLHTLEGHRYWVESVSVTPDGRRAVSGSKDKTVRVWDLESGVLLRTLPRIGNDTVSSVSLAPDGRRAISGSEDNTLQVWDLESGVCLRTLEGHTGLVSSVNVTPDGRRAVSASGDHTLRVWDLESGACLRVLEGHRRGPFSVGVTPDCRLAVVGSGDETHNDLWVWDLESGECLHVLRGHREAILSVTVTPDGRRAVSGGSDQTLRVWDLESGTCIRVLQGHSDGVRSVSAMPDGCRAVSASSDKTVRLWDLASGASLSPLHRHGDSVKSVSAAPDSWLSVSSAGYNDKTVKVWDLKTGKCMRTLEGHLNGVWSVRMTPDGRRAISLGGHRGDNTLRVWDLESGSRLHDLVGHSDSVYSVSVTADSRRAVSASHDESLRVWDLESGACLRTLEGPCALKSVSVTSDGHRAVSGGVDGSLRVWSLESDSCLRTLGGNGGWINSVSVTPDGRRAISMTDYDRSLRIWDLESGACLRTLEGHTSSVSSMAVTPDGRVVSGGEDNTLRVWDLVSGACLHVMEGHNDKVSSVSVTPDGRRAVSGSPDKTLRVWDLENGQLLSLEVVPSAILSVALGGHGSAICTGTEGGDVLILELQGAEFGQDLKPDLSNEAYEQLLRRGLEFSRHEKGDDHEETLAHLQALAVHLENTGRPNEARQFDRERDQLTSGRDVHDSATTE